MKYPPPAPSPSKRFADDFLYAATIGLCVLAVLFLLVPLAVTAIMSFDARSYLGPMPPREFSLRWYERFFTESAYIEGLQTSFLLALCTVSISVTVGVLTAFVLDRYNFAGKAALTAFFLSPLVVPPVVIGFALLLFLSQAGIYEGFLRLLCGHVIITVPYAIRATMAGFVGIHPSLSEAALNLGANERTAFFTIILPLARTGIVAGAIFAFAVSMDDIAVSLFLTDATTQTLPLALISQMRANFDLTIAAAAMLLTAFTVLLILVLDRAVGMNRIVGQGIHRT